MTLTRFLLVVQYGGSRPTEISVARWNAMIRQIEINPPG